MSHVFADSGNNGDADKRWTAAVGATTSTDVPYVTTPTSRSIESSGLLYKQVTAADDEWFIMGRFLVTSNLDTNYRFFIEVFSDGGTTEHLCFCFKNSGVDVRRGNESGTILASWSTASLVAATWYEFRAGVKIADSGGLAWLEVDGTERINFSGDTRNGGTSVLLDKFQLRANGVTNRYKDIKVNDGLGPAPHNGFYAAVPKVQPAVPTANGTTTGMTPSTGSNFQNVDERPYSATDYNQGAAGVKDTYALQDLPAGVTSVVHVQAFAIAKKTDAGALSLRTVLRSGGTDHVGSTVGLGLADALFLTDYPLDPATSADWTVSNVNALEAGAEVV